MHPILGQVLRRVVRWGVARTVRHLVAEAIASPSNDDPLLQHPTLEYAPGRQAGASPRLKLVSPITDATELGYFHTRADVRVPTPFDADRAIAHDAAKAARERPMLATMTAAYQKRIAIPAAPNCGPLETTNTRPSLDESFDPYMPRKDAANAPMRTMAQIQERNALVETYLDAVVGDPRTQSRDAGSISDVAVTAGVAEYTAAWTAAHAATTATASITADTDGPALRLTSAGWTDPASPTQHPPHTTP